MTELIFNITGRLEILFLKNTVPGNFGMGIRCTFKNEPYDTVPKESI